MTPFNNTQRPGYPAADVNSAIDRHLAGARPTQQPAESRVAPPALPSSHEATTSTGRDTLGSDPFSRPPESVEVIFSKSYMAHGDPVRKITLRRPVTREIVQAGTPSKMTLGDRGEVVDMDRRWSAIVKYIELLASPPLPPSTVAQLEFEDLAECAMVIEGFFLAAMSRPKAS